MAEKQERNREQDERAARLAELGHSSPQMTARYRRFVRGEYNPAARTSNRTPADPPLPVAK